MLDAADLKEPTCENFSPIETYHDAMNRIMCSVPSSECYLNECTACLGTSALKDFVTSVLEEQCINRVEFQTWQQTDRSTLRTEITDAEDFAEQICERLLELKPHSFTAKQQSYFFKDLKDTLKEGEFLILCDFAENYAFVVQNAAQSFNWKLDQIIQSTIK